ncbi:hypothetical protein A9958_07845 [Staphylococcus simulans]|uniref:YfbU family protein n=1 Tax=Staphylococcus simulans TaxID=1286 RepID=UPI000D0A4DEF|nr:YfbU family protein [Staphylococcus simulans]AVO02316.1 hypothetical protein BI282_07835 [Staphylococcus simulans]AVO05262.1 hypothetical protein BI283_07800 [Staphylococcus simulans]AWG18865.1 hypothetical protein A9958_07845 [Staphylococcus simulans]AWI01812.1 hypothetical protein A7X73_07730 [Staphylococcus simulans]
MDHLSDYERVSLINQFEILKELTDNQEDKKRYEGNIEILHRGLTGFYDIVANDLQEERSIEKHDFVTDVLNLYRDVIFSFDSLPEEEKTEKLKKDTSFKGFDLGNNEQVDYYSHADIYLNVLNRFEELKKHLDENNEDLDSHGFGPSIDDLQRYVSRKKEVRDSKGYDKPLTKEDLEYIFE